MVNFGGGGWHSCRPDCVGAAATASGGTAAAVAPSATIGCLDCLQDVVRALGMGSCLSLPDTPGRSKGGERRQGFAEELLRAPGRLAGVGSSAAASLYTRQGRKGTNQDAMVVWEGFNGRSDTTFCGVFDGHGPQGHLVAQMVRDMLPIRLHESLNAVPWRESTSSYSESITSDDTSSVGADETAHSSEIEQKQRNSAFLKAMRDSFLKAFKVMDKELKLHGSIDSHYSGTTAVTIMKLGPELIVGNVGDSRAILATRDQNGQLVACQLTVDLKPDLPREAERIKRCNGRVFAHPDEPDVARMWLPNVDSPGLAMARAFGDFCLKDFGLISVPVVSFRRITVSDEFVVLATDGVWDVLSNTEVVDIVASAPAQSLAARRLIDAATRSWKVKYPTSKIDDCAAICLFLNSDNTTTSKTDASGVPMDADMPSASTRAAQQGRKDLPGDGKQGVDALEAQQLLEADIESDSETFATVERADTIMALPRFAVTDNQSSNARKK